MSLGATTVNDSNDTWVFSYQDYAGVRYEFSARFSLGLFYHYNVADAPSWKFNSIPAGNLKLDSIRTALSHSPGARHVASWRWRGE